MKVFLIDDSAQVIQRLQEMLAPVPGVEVLGYASDLAEALRAIRASSPSVVVLDIHISGDNGIEVIKTIKKEKPETVVIVLTNYTSPQYQKRSVAAGAHSFLDKSKDFTQVPWVVQALSIELERRRDPLSDGDGDPRLKSGPI